MASHHAGAEDYLHEEGAMASTPSVAGATITPPSTPGGGSTFLDLSGSAYASESVMNSGAQNKVKSQVATRGCPTRLPKLQTHVITVVLLNQKPSADQA